jgi:Glycosyl transferase family 2
MPLSSGHCLSLSLIFDVSGGDIEWIFPSCNHAKGTFFLSHTQAVTEMAAICAMVKNEEAYLDEWVDYHVALGFSEIYVYDNSPDHDLQQWGLTKKNLTLIHFPGKGKQGVAYLNCAKNAQKKHTWATFFDADEYLVLKKHETVVELLHDHCREGALSINWIIMSSSGHQVYRQSIKNRNLKTLIKPRLIRSIM